ncbi:MAG: hypothetical protein GXO87_09490 [Chlorobi bacterium]|nr:hypothetical protein [Chlorobiota bacterium]
MAEGVKSISKIFDNLNDLKNAFKIGEKVVPIIQSLTEFMQEIVPLLEKINSSISESATQMPQASNQINSVTSATELATNEILDLVDKITDNVNETDKKLAEFGEDHQERGELLVQLREKILDNAEAVEIVDKIIEKDKMTEVIAELRKRIQTVNEDSFKITMSLQVQDITSQQLAAVNHLIESVNKKLSKLVEQINMSELKDEIKELSIDVPDDAHYDPNAKYDHDQSKQDEADKLINQNQKASQDEIDKLFS